MKLYEQSMLSKHKQLYFTLANETMNLNVDAKISAATKSSFHYWLIF